jgi:hypothetical protein
MSDKELNAPRELTSEELERVFGGDPNKEHLATTGEGQMDGRIPELNPDVRGFVKK